jgi:hypothetical protein
LSDLFHLGDECPQCPVRFGVAKGQNIHQEVVASRNRGESIDAQY